MNINSSLQKTPIAVIGLSAMFADAKNIEEFWTNIVAAKDSIKDVPENRWKIEDYYDPNVFAPDKTYCKRGGFLPKIDFNPMEFGLPPNILEVTDASQLLGLVAARNALEDAGYGKESTKFTKELKEKTGVLLGVGGGQKLITPLIARLQYPIWEKALRSSGIAEADIPHIVDKMKKAYIGWNENSFPGLLGNVISGRITNRFDLGGINSVVDAACAASLSAIKMALSELVEGRCDMMLTGGVDTDNSPFMYMSFSKTPAFSKSGNISPFSDQADGMLIGEGLGILVLKRLEDAERDGDRIYAVIKGVGTSSDGRFKSVYAPRSSGQALAMNRAYEDAGYPAASVGLIEAHGTGTAAGDKAELNSMNMVFSANNDKKQHIALGSVKSQVGHTKAAAGSAGMVKAVLALHHKVLPPTINVKEPSTGFDIKESALYINTEARPWLKNGYPRRASVSAFGFGGINVHITLEEYQKEQKSAYRLHQQYKSVLLQADNPADLLQLCQKTVQDLQTKTAEIHYLQLTEASQNTVLSQHNARLGFVAASIDDCVDNLQKSITTLQKNTADWTHPSGIYYRAKGLDANTKVAALFSGQGAQYTGMGKELVNAYPQLLQSFTEMDALFQQEGKPLLSKTVFPIPAFSDEERQDQQLHLTKTEYAQPAIGTLSKGMYEIMQSAGFKADFAAGHSFGELTALWAAGVFDDATFYALAKNRGAAMAANSSQDSGAMLAVKASAEEVNKEIGQITAVSIANINSGSQVVLGGSTTAIQQAAQLLDNKGYKTIPLPVSAAFHTSFVGHAQKPFADFIESQPFSKPTIPVYATQTAQPYPNDINGIKTILKDQILKPVFFKNQIEHIYDAGGRVFVEFGPKGVLKNLVSDILKDKEHLAIALNANAKKDSDFQFRQAVVQLQVAGLPLKNIDPFKIPSKTPAVKTKLNLDLSGNNYVSPQTQKAYQDVLNDGFKISGGTTIIEKEVIKEVEKIVEVERIVEIPVNGHSNQTTIEEEEMMNKEVIQILQNTLEHFKTQQSKSLEMFERFIQDQNQQSQQLIQLLMQQMNGQAEVNLPLAKPVAPSTNGVRNGIAKNVSSNGVKPAPTPTSAPVAVLEAPQAVAVTTSTTTGLSDEKLKTILLAVISEKTGYPTEMLDLSMDMEADLGIDSIKRVEIFGTMTEQNPEISGMNPQELTELRTLQEIVDYIAKNASGGAAVSPAPAVTETPTPSAVAPATPSSNGGGLSDEKLKAILLAVISEKTGYPTEMLDLSMDMEADLGIDSIKRVEIFGTMTEQNPEISGMNPQELTELRTLQEIVDYIAQNGKKKQ